MAKIIGKTTVSMWIDGKWHEAGTLVSFEPPTTTPPGLQDAEAHFAASLAVWRDKWLGIRRSA